MTPEQIVRRVAAVRGIAVSKLLSPNRMARVALARQEAMWLLRRAGCSSPETARLVGRHDHTTVLWGEAKIWARIKANPDYRAELEAMVRPAGAFVAALEAA